MSIIASSARAIPLVQVFYLAHASTPSDCQKTATEVRATTRCRYLLTYNAASAIAIRGSAEQIALANRLIQEQDK